MGSVRMFGAVLLLAALVPLAASVACATEAPPTFQFSWGSGSPAGIAVDSHGNVYVVDQASCQISKHASSGSSLGYWGGSGSGDGQFSQPYGIGIDALDHVYVVDVQTSVVQVFTSNGVFLRKWGVRGTGEGQLISPRDVAILADGSVLVADRGNGRVVRFDADGRFLGYFAPGVFRYPVGVDATRTGDVFVSDESGDPYSVYRCDATGAVIVGWGIPGSGLGQFRGPGGLGADPFGRVYATDHNNNRVQCFSTTGEFLCAWGTQGSANGQFKSPLDLAVSPDGLIYVSDTGNHRVQVFASIVVDATPTSWGRLKALYR